MFYVVLVLAVAVTAFAARVMWAAQTTPQPPAVSRPRSAELPAWLTSFVRPDFLAPATPVHAGSERSAGE